MTEEEFQKVFRMRKKFDDDYTAFGIPPMDPAGQAKWTGAQLQLDEQIKQSLGEQRYLEYRNERDWHVSSLKQVAEAENVPKETAMKMFDIRDTARTAAQNIRSNSSLSDTQRQGALQALQNETQQAVYGILGQKGGDTYIQKISGNWWKELKP